MILRKKARPEKELQNKLSVFFIRNKSKRYVDTSKHKRRKMIENTTGVFDKSLENIYEKLE